jgi:hypothetical protein
MAVLALLVAALSAAVSFDSRQVVMWLPPMAPAVLASKDLAAPVPAETLKAAVAAHPVDARLVTALAYAELQLGNNDRSVNLMKLAAGLSGHEARAHLWLFSRALNLNDTVGVSKHFDILLRTHLELLDKLMMFIRLAGWSPALFRDMAGYAATMPSWRADWWAWLAVIEPDPQIGLTFLGLLAGTPGQVTTAELGQLLDRLTAKGRVGEAYAAWIQSLPEERRKKNLNIFDGRFEMAPLAGPFEWKLSTSPDVAISFTEAANIPGRTAFIEILQTQHPQPLLEQVIMLKPGRWQVSGMIKTDSVSAYRGLIWSVTCLGAGEIGRSKTFLNSTAWGELTFAIEVPPQGCEAQRVTLGPDVKAALDAKISGRVNVADMKIVALD